MLQGRHWMLLLLLSLATKDVVLGFSSIGVPGVQLPQRPIILRLHEKPTAAEVTKPFFMDTEDTDDEATNGLLRNAEFLDISLKHHRPLGCTVEESLPDGDHVFISKVTNGGNADKAGLQVGDVLLACSDLFGTELAPVDGMDSAIGLISARPSHESLEFRIARTTAVLEQHEAALVELCSDPEATSTEMENCLVDYIEGGYDFSSGATAMGSQDDEDEEECNVEEDDNCMLDSAFDLWNEEFDVYPQPEVVEDRPQPTVKKAKPWSSRSSPSGTFVRDPVTGEMRNIDA